MTIGEFIKMKRKELKLTQDDLARSANVTKSTVSRWESGDIDKMKLPMIKAVADTLMIDPVLLVKPHEMLMPDEEKMLYAYRAAEDWKKIAVKKLLDIDDESEE